MDAHTFADAENPAQEEPAPRIERRDTGVRILLTVLFALIWGLVESGLALIVVFALVWALITRQAPPPRLREFSNRLVSYAYRVWRYLTQNEARVPFPFSEFPQPLEPPAELGGDAAEELHDELVSTEPDDEGQA